MSKLKKGYIHMCVCVCVYIYIYNIYIYNLLKMSLSKLLSELRKGQGGQGEHKCYFKQAVTL